MKAIFAVSVFIIGFCALLAMCGNSRRAPSQADLGPWIESMEAGR